ncbi:SH3 domain-containing protein [Leptospira koniambonensis]|uniref:SH3 domain-containing protein n=1 Tax=Leptospira koniambonensis TaxID=2484950 RepID=UPI003EBA8603
MNLKSISLIICIITIFSFCKKEAPIGRGYVLESGLCVHKGPSILKECEIRLDAGAVVQILEYKIPDKERGEGLLWYRIKSEKTEGYISLDEELSRNKFASIFPQTTERMMVNASSLRLRSIPSLLGDIITMLPNGTEVKVTGKTPFKVQIDGKYDGWVEVTTPSGQTGFSYAGFLISKTIDQNTSSGTENNSEGTPIEIPEGSEDISGFLILNGGATAWADPGKTEWQSGSCDKNKSIPGDTFVRATQKVKVSGVTYYHGERKFQYYTINSLEPNGCLDAWFSANDVEYHNQTLFEWSSKQYAANFDKSLIQFLSTNGYNPVEDLSTLTIEEISKKKKETIYRISYDTFDSEFNRKFDINNIYLKNSQGIFVLLENTKDAYETDLDGDGVSEWKVNTSGRSDSATTFYRYSGTSLVSFLTVSESDYGSCQIAYDGGNISTGPDDSEKTIHCTISEVSPYIYVSADKEYKFKYSKGVIRLTK